MNRQIIRAMWHTSIQGNEKIKRSVMRYGQNLTPNLMKNIKGFQQIPEGVHVKIKTKKFQ